MSRTNTSFSSLAALTPRGPSFTVDWPAVVDALELHALAGTEQDAVHHAEGDVAIHTRMVLESLASLPEYRALPDDEKLEVFLACALHDVSKPETTTRDADGRVHARGHSKRGAIRARRLLWERDVPFHARERVCGAVAFHQLPFFAVELDANIAERKLIAASMVTRLDHLALVAEADARGRVCADAKDQARLLDNIALCRELAHDLGCARNPYAFVDDVTRLAFFHDPRRTRYDVAHDAHSVDRDVVVLSGLPASGKDRWCAAHANGRDVVSLDALRDELDVEHGGPQRAVVDAARERCRASLRLGRGFVWNATNLVRALRQPTIKLALDYGARVRVVYLESSRAALDARNRERAVPVPAAAIERMLRRWELPDCTEAHSVDHIVDA